MVCDTAKPWYLVEPHEAAARANEVEANEFAAELLTPSGWLARLIGSRGPDPGALTREVLSIGVSAQAACIGFLRYFQAGGSGQSSTPVDRIHKRTDLETRIAPPQVGSALARGLLDQFSTRVDEVPHGRARVVWWTFRASASGELRTALSGRSSSEIEALLLERHAGPDADRIRRSLSGVIGSAFGSAIRDGDTSATALEARLRGRFAKERQKIPASMIDDPDFSEWLARRALDLASRATSPRQ